MKTQNRTRIRLLAVMLLAAGTSARAKVVDNDLHPPGEKKGESLVEVGSAEGENLGAVVGVNAKTGKHVYVADEAGKAVVIYGHVGG